MTKFFLFLSILATLSLQAQQKPVEKNDFRAEWMKFEDGHYSVIGDDRNIKNTVYFSVNAAHFPAGSLLISSARNFFIFFNKKLSGEYQGRVMFDLDSLAGEYRTTSLLVCVYQPDLNPRDLTTSVVFPERQKASSENLFRPPTYFKDFVITAGLLIILLSVVVIRFNPKLASDYLSAGRIFSLREVDDAQSNARLTSSANVQFYIITSLLLGFYLIIVLNFLPDAYELPLYFRGNSFWSVSAQWLKLSVIILALFFLKIFLIFLLTRLFDFRGLTRIHFFNWVRLLLIAFGVFGTAVFIYFIRRGQREDFYVVFLTLIVATLTVWIFVVFLKLSSKREHSMFHLFSYICATELIPLLFTIKVLFQ